MKTLITTLAAMAISVSAMAETAPVHFRGILNLGNAKHFSVASDGGAKSAWVSVGDSFDGYEVAGFDEEEHALLLQKEGKEFRIGLAGASSAAAAPPQGPAIEEAAELLRSMKFEEMMTKSIEQQKEMMEKMFRQMGQQGGQQMDERALAQQMRFIEEFHKLLDWGGMQEDIAKAYGETFTREELKGLIDFYSTPAGQGFVDKQGELMQKMSELMQPRIMGAMARMQPLIEEMAREAGQPQPAQP
jgi:uncharacterized protein